MKSAFFPLDHEPAIIREPRSCNHLLVRLARSGALILLACLCLSAHAQTDEWAWMSGSSMGGQPGVYGVYGTLGTPAAGNIPGGRTARFELDRQQRPSLALWGRWLRCQRQFRRSQRPLGVQSFHERMGMDERKQLWSPAMVASPESTARWAYLLPETSPEADMPRQLDRQQRPSLALWRLWLRCRR